MKDSSSDILTKLLKAIAHRRGLAMTIVESQIGHLPIWEQLRPRLLGIFGENGLTRDVKKIMDASQPANQGERSC